MPRSVLELSPEVLKWARESAGFDLQAAAEKLKVSPDRLRSWEEGHGSPETKVFHKMVVVYRRPQTVFLFSSPPHEKELPQDFRTVGSGPHRLSQDVRFAIRQAEFLRQEISALVSDSPKTSQFLWAASADERPEEHGERLRTQLHVSFSDQLQWGAGEAFKAWRVKVQDNGILVFSLKMPREDCLGFSLFDGDELPAIVVNSIDETDQAKTFTLFHELGHILLRQPGICSDFGRTTKKYERWCNKFAGSVLMPERLIRTLLSEKGLLETQELTFPAVTHLAKQLKVSRQATALRLVDLGIADPSLYEVVLEGLKNEPKKKKSKPGPVLPHIRTLSKVGTKAATLVFSALSRGTIDAATASNILNLNPKWFGKLSDSLRIASRM